MVSAPSRDDGERVVPPRKSSTDPPKGILQPLHYASCRWDLPRPPSPSGIPVALPARVVPAPEVSRYCQMPSRGQHHPWLRTAGTEDGTMEEGNRQMEAARSKAWWLNRAWHLGTEKCNSVSGARSTRGRQREAGLENTARRPLPGVWT